MTKGAETGRPGGNEAAGGEHGGAAGQGARAVFLDRDGTLIEEVGYLNRIDRAVLYPWSIDAVRLLNRAGFKVVVISNQSGVARGYFDESFVAEVEAWLSEQMKAGGARIDAFYYCPHHPDARIERYRLDCDCRKPRPGLARRAAAEMNLDLARSIVAGDWWIDVQVAQAVGAAGILVRTGFGASEERKPPEGVAAAAIVDNLIEAVSFILCNMPGREKDASSR